jgi:NAD(P)-dependent dehydrogenase (short-subunit alcohol dehydrogenase family)
MDELHDKVAVVTGAGSGIGRALALRFAAEGMHVALGDIDEAGMAETVALIGAASPTVRTMTATVDVRHAFDVAAFADGIFETWEHVDVLCNTAGVFMGGYLWERRAEELEYVIGVNLWGILHGIRSFVPRMIAQDTEGHIVNTASIAGLFGSPFSGPYNVSKFAAAAAAESLARDLIASGSKLRASLLCPGIINTNIALDAQDRPAREGVDSPADQQFVTDLLVDMVHRGKDPSMVAGLVVDAIRTERFLILTHDHHAGYLRDRGEDLANGEIPRLADYS